jgi:DNA-binding GntR family transcriptional regulator
MTKNSNAQVLSSDVFSTLKNRIIRWQYPPGFRITEEGLCEEFGVSRSPVREALQMLMENGLVEKEPHRGYGVKQPDLQQIHELYEVRLALELYVGEKLARQGMPAESWQKLHDTWAMLTTGAEGEDLDFAVYDEEFHEVLAISTGNATLAQQLKNIDERLHFVRMFDITSPERLKITCEQHLRILDCIRSGDVSCIREAIESNIFEGRKHVEMAVKEALARAYMGVGSGSQFTDRSNP